MHKVILILFSMASINIWAETLVVDKNISINSSDLSKYSDIIIKTSGKLKINSSKKDIILKLDSLILKGKLYTSGYIDSRTIGGKGGDNANKIGGKPFNGGGGSGASSLYKGNPGVLSGRNENVTYDINTGKPISGGSGGASGLSSNNIKLYVKKVQGNGTIELNGQKGNNGEDCIHNVKDLTVKCSPFDCCIENGGKGSCIERGNCYEECLINEESSIAAGGGGGGGNGGNLYISKNMTLDNIRFVSKGGEAGRAGKCLIKELRAYDGKAGKDGELIQYD